MAEILSVILKILFIVFFFGFCVFIHEFGHLLVALWKGLHVEKFSVGMGPKLWGFTYKGVEYVISWLPFGGYVSLPQLDPTDTPHSSDNKPLPQATPGARAWTAFAGPLFNVLFGFLLATIMWGVGLWRPTPATSVTVGALPAYLPASAPFPPESDVSLPGKMGGSLPWEALCYQLGRRDEVPQELDLLVREPDAQEARRVSFVPQKNPEWLSGLRPGDRIVEVNGTGFRGGVEEFRKEYVYGNRGHVDLKVIRQGTPLEFRYVPGRNPEMEDLPFPFMDLLNPLHVAGIRPGSPAEKAGLKPGDQLLAVKRLATPRPLGGSEAPQEDTLLVRDVAGFQNFIRTGGIIPLQVTYRRGGQEREAQVTPFLDERWPDRPLLGVLLTSETPRTIQHINPWAQFSEVMGTTTRTLGLLFAPLTSRAKSVVTGKPRETPSAQVSVRHMSGPLGIIQALWFKLKAEGYRGGFSFIILISFSLAFMNLLPLPVLDGGHIVFAAVEAVTRRRIPATFFKYVYNTFAILLILLMLYITLFDGRRILRYSRQGQLRQQKKEQKQERTSPDPQKGAGTEAGAPQADTP